MEVQIFVTPVRERDLQYGRRWPTGDSQTLLAAPVAPLSTLPDYVERDRTALVLRREIQGVTTVSIETRPSWISDR